MTNKIVIQRIRDRHFLIDVDGEIVEFECASSEPLDVMMAGHEAWDLNIDEEVLMNTEMNFHHSDGSVSRVTLKSVLKALLRVHEPKENGDD